MFQVVRSRAEVGMTSEAVWWHVQSRLRGASFAFAFAIATTCPYKLTPQIQNLGTAIQQMRSCIRDAGSCQVPCREANVMHPIACEGVGCEVRKLWVLIIYSLVDG